MVARNRTSFSKFATRVTLGVAASLGVATNTPVFATLRITEVQSNSGVGGTPDWFEVTNYGSSAVTLTGYKMDDGSFTFATSVELFGVTSLAPAATAVFLESAAGADIPAFRTYWGSNASAVPVGYYAGTGISFSSAGDGVVVFDPTGTEVTPRTSFGSAVANGGATFYWAYDSSGAFGLGTQANGLVSTVGTIPGENGGISQVTYLSATTLPQNTGSPGTAAVVPEPSTVALAAAGLGLAGVAARRRLRKA